MPILFSVFACSLQAAAFERGIVDSVSLDGSSALPSGRASARRSEGLAAGFERADGRSEVAFERADELTRGAESEFCGDLRDGGVRQKQSLPDAFHARCGNDFADGFAVDVPETHVKQTPCPAYQYDDRCGLSRVYNEVASAVCAELGVQTVDLSAIGERNYDKQPDGAHYNDEGNDLLAAAVSAAVESALKRKF